MSPLFEGNMLSLGMASLCVSNRIARGAVVKSSSKNLSQFSAAKKHVKLLFRCIFRYCGVESCVNSCEFRRNYANLTEIRGIKAVSLPESAGPH